VSWNSGKSPFKNTPPPGIQLDKLKSSPPEKAGDMLPKYIPLSNYHRLFMIMEAPTGRFPYTEINYSNEQSTGSSAHKYTLGSGKELWIKEYAGPSVIGLGPKVLKAELARLEALKLEVEKTIENLEQIGEAFSRGR
jgi:hypothetical protein